MVKQLERTTRNKKQIVLSVLIMISVIPFLLHAEPCKTPIECYEQAVKKLQQAKSEISNVSSENAVLKEEIKRINNNIGELSGKIETLKNEIQNTFLALENVQKTISERLNKLEASVFKPHHNNTANSKGPYHAPGEAPWGGWTGTVFCPSDHYVCGAEQKIEGIQDKGDDTAMNGIRIYCCPF